MSNKSLSVIFYRENFRSLNTLGPKSLIKWKFKYSMEACWQMWEICSEENKKHGKHYFHFILCWRIDSIALPNSLPSLYRISQVFVSPDSFAFLLNGTLRIDINTLSFSSSTRKENLLLDVLNLKKKMSFVGLMGAFKYIWTAIPPYSRYRPPRPLIP